MDDPMSSPPAESFAPAPHSLTDVIDAIESLCERNHGSKVSVGDIAHMLGPRSFSPFILAVGLIALTPIDSIPTLPSTFGVIIFLTVGQMLLGRRSLWLPGFAANRAVAADRLKKALDWLRPRAKWCDRWLRSRFAPLTHGPFLYAIAIACLVQAALMPMLELVPFVSTVPAAAFTAFGIALLLGDGLAAIAGFALSAITLALVVNLALLPFGLHG
jgi:hypothetical protein